MTELRGGFEPGNRVEHEELGPGTVKAHPDGEYRESEARAYVYFDETSETTIRHVWVNKLDPLEES